MDAGLSSRALAEVLLEYGYRATVVSGAIGILGGSFRHRPQVHYVKPDVVYDHLVVGWAKSRQTTTQCQLESKASTNCRNNFTLY
jgi:hypothetical protein